MLSKRMPIQRSKCTITKYREFPASERQNNLPDGTAVSADATFILDGLKEALGIEEATKLILSDVKAGKKKKAVAEDATEVVDDVEEATEEE